MSAALPTPWSLLLATIVAFNTLIYVGLTLSKLIPWPRQFRPSRVRRWAERIGMTITEESVVRDIPRARPAESADPYEALRYLSARESIPQTCTLAGGLVMLFSVTAAFALKNLTFTAHVVEFLAGLALLITGVVLWYGDFAGRTMMRTLAFAFTVLTVGLLVEGVHYESLAPIAYSTVVITAYMPLVLDWRTSLVAGAVILIAVAIAGFRFQLTTGVGLEVLALSAFMVGALLLHIRLRGIRALAEVQALAASAATTDGSTGLLNRRGMLSVAMVIAANAARARQPVFLASVRLERWDKAHRQYGIHYSSAVLRALAQVVRSEMHDGDLAARWEPDEIVILGQGTAPDAARLKERFEAGLVTTGVALGRWPLEITVRSVTGDPDTDTFGSMLDLARAR